MSKYNEAYKGKDLPAIIIEKSNVDINLAKLTNRDKRKIKEKTGVDLMQKFMEMQSVSSGAQVNPAVDKVFADVDEEVKEKLDLNAIKTQLSNAIPSGEEDPVSKIFSDIGAEVEHLLFKFSLKHDDEKIKDATVDRVIADLETLEYVRALMWLVMGRDMEEQEAEEIVEKADDSGNLDIPSKTEGSAEKQSK